MRLLCLIVLLSAAPAVAQTGALDAPSPPPGVGGVSAQRAAPDFFFGRPRTSLAVRANWTFARAGSDWFDFVTNELTLNRKDFRAAGLAADVTVVLAPRLDLVVGADYVNTQHDSEFREFVDDNRQPIQQTTRLRHSALTAGVRFALTPRGREISRFAWVPSRIVPYVGAGGGAVWYRVQQHGEFVDFRTFSIFTDLLESSGWAPAGYASAGLDVHVVRRVYLQLDGRYLWAAPDLSEPWRSFDALDLAGMRLSTGIGVVF